MNVHDSMYPMFLPITLTLMTLTTITDQSILDKLFLLIQRKSAHQKEWRAIENLEAIYDTELQAIKKQLHTTATGEIMLIKNMLDDHLLNYAKSQLRYHKWNYKSIPKAYMDEIKARPGMLDQLIDYEPVLVVSQQDSNDWSEDIPF